MLLDAGANVDGLDGNRDTPLCWACRSGQLEAARALVDCKADVKRACKDVWTPLRECKCIAWALEWTYMMPHLWGNARAAGSSLAIQTVTVCGVVTHQDVIGWAGALSGQVRVGQAGAWYGQVRLVGRCIGWAGCIANQGSIVPSMGLQPAVPSCGGGTGRPFSHKCVADPLLVMTCLLMCVLLADYAAYNPTGTGSAVDICELLLEKGADPTARTRDGSTASAVVGTAPGERSEDARSTDDDMRDLLQGAEYDWQG
eukprot:357902-Chlamydomonas_euryale.AAC.15